MIASVPTRTIAEGVDLPLMGFGTWQISDADGEDAVRAAIDIGYRHVDTAQMYRNERGVGAGVRASGLPRDQLFVTTKFSPRGADPVADLERSLDRLGLEQVDLYLVHWPTGDEPGSWARMREALQRGLTRSIGVSNYSLGQIDEVIAGVPPAVNQVPFSPTRFRRALLRGCEQRGVTLESYSPLDQGGPLLRDPVVTGVAERVGATTAQVVLAWALHRGVPVIPKSGSPERMRQNFGAQAVGLSDDDVAALDALDRSGGSERPD